jgi:hypothetical protein
MSKSEKRKLDGDEWQRRCKDDFAELARQAKESAKRRKVDNVQDEEEETERGGSDPETGATNGTSQINGTVGVNGTFDDERQGISSQRSNQEETVA